MSVPITYPASLPVPAAAPIQSAERRVLDTLEAREFQRDRLAYQSVTFPPFTSEQQEIFEAWWKTTLSKGGKWFSATWPLPEGWVVGVRRFIGTPRWEFIPKPSPAGMMRVTAEFEVRGVGQLPVQYIAPLLSMHFDEDFTDESGHLIAPWHWINTDVPPSIQVADPKFGGYMFSAASDYPQPLISDIRGPLNLNEYGEWQSRFWVKLNDSSLYSGTPGGYIWSLHGTSNNGASISTPGGSSLQIIVRIDRIGVEPAGFASLRVQYNGHDATNPSMNAGVAMAPVSTDSELVPIDDEWHFIAVCGDATSTRAYIDSNLALDDAASPHPAGSRPLWYSADSSFTNQVFIVGGAFAGGISDGGWPSTAVFTALFVGGLDDLQITNGPGSVEFTGTTITVPTAPFSRYV